MQNLFFSQYFQKVVFEHHSCHGDSLLCEVQIIQFKWFKTSVLHKDTLTYFKAPFRFTKKLPNYTPNRFPLKHDSYYVNIFSKIQVRLYQKSIRVNLEKTAGAHRSFFLGYNDTHQKLRFTQGLFIPDTNLSFILVRETCFDVTVVIDTKPKVTITAN